MNEKVVEITKSPVSNQERKRRKRESIIIVVIIVVVAFLTYFENRTIHFGTDIPVSNTILMFVLININLILLFLLLFLVFRNLVKLFYDRKRKVMGSKLRTRLVVAFITLSLFPAIILFFFSVNFITKSVEFWFNVPVEQALINSVKVGRNVYVRVEQNHDFFLERVSYQIQKREFLDKTKRKALSRYIQVIQREFNFQAVEVYTSDFKRLTFSLSPELENEYFGVVSEDELKKDMGKKRVRSVFSSLPSGEVVRTIGTVPFGVQPGEADGYVILAALIPQEISADMKSISRGFEEYQQIKLLKGTIQSTIYVYLAIVGLLVVFCAIWFGFYIAKSISIPIKELAEGTRRVAEGDLRFSIDPVADDEIGSLVESFNKMTGDLRIGREQLEFSARMLREQNIEIEERRKYMEIVLKNISTGVITIDGMGLVSTINKSAEKMLNLKSDEILNRNYNKLLTGDYLDIAREMMDKLDLSKDGSVELPLGITVDGKPRSFLVNINELKDDAGNHMGIVMVFDDLTELEKAQRMAAWREVARRLAHEVKNPLTPLSLSAQRLQRKYSTIVNDPIFEECTHTIIDHVDLIRNIVNEFSDFAKFPSANRKSCELAPIIEETVALYKEGLKDIEFITDVAVKLPPLNLDRQQIKQAMINLVDNAVAAIKQKGMIGIILKYEVDTQIVRIEVSDNGPGISDENKARLFEPNFSTKKAGMGLGLAIVSTIVADHDGRISIQDNSPQGAKFIIDLPV